MQENHSRDKMSFTATELKNFFCNFANNHPWLFVLNDKEKAMLEYVKELIETHPNFEYKEKT